MCQRLGLPILLVALSLAGIAARPRAQNPFENLSLGAMSLAGNIAEAVQSGAALNRDLNIDNPLLSLQSKTSLGYGDAIRPMAPDSSEEDRRRRKRRHLHRHKRAPCFWKMGTAATTAASADDDVEARRRRAAARKRAANNASRSRLSPKTTGKKKLQRRRRQTDQGQMPANANGTDPLGLGDRMKAMWLSFVDNVTDVVQQVRQKISESANAAASSASSAG
ncbi:uncharacterized protein [Drosophila takahashii]|uniref:uncharacterized protein n=1 Tax=Drosophila takahashii TaxID=29030 RepID=UPI0007E68AC8|nr:uncharacterized protein LOC108061004 [Drosophila takahashii]